MGCTMPPWFSALHQNGYLLQQFACLLWANSGHQLLTKRKTASRRSLVSSFGRNDRGRLSRAMLPDVARANLVGRKVCIEHVRIFADGSVCRVAEIFSGVPAENRQEASADDAVSLAEGEFPLFIVAGDRSASQ